MFEPEERQHAVKRTARHRWHPLFLRVYGITPWQMGDYNLREFGQLVKDLEENGLGGSGLG